MDLRNTFGIKIIKRSIGTIALLAVPLVIAFGYISEDYCMPREVDYHAWKIEREPSLEKIRNATFNGFKRKFERINDPGKIWIKGTEYTSKVELIRKTCVNAGSFFLDSDYSISFYFDENNKLIDSGVTYTAMFL